MKIDEVTTSGMTTMASFKLPELINYEAKTLDELKEYRKWLNITQVYPHGDTEITAYLIKMIDILLEKVERLEKLQDAE